MAVATLMHLIILGNAVYVHVQYTNTVLLKALKTVSIYQCHLEQFHILKAFFPDDYSKNLKIEKLMEMFSKYGGNN